MDKELEAIKQIIESLEKLETDEKKRVLDYIFNRIGLKNKSSGDFIIDVENQNKVNDNLFENANNTKTEKIIYNKDIRSLREEKDPKTAIQMTVLVAYYLSELAPDGEKKDSINSNDITKYFKQANFELPKGEPIYVLRNARSAGYLESTGVAGCYKLNPVGYNLVAHNLPNNNTTKKTTLKKNKKTKSKTK